MNIYSNSFYNYSTSFFNEKILPNLTTSEQKKLKIFLVACAAVSCLTICYLIIRKCCFKATDLTDDENQKKSPVSGLLSKLGAEKDEQENVVLKDSPSPRKNDKEDRKRSPLKEQSPAPTAKDEKPKNEIIEGPSPRKNDNDKEDRKRSPLKEQSPAPTAKDEKPKNEIIEGPSPRKNDKDKEDQKTSPLKEQSPTLEIQTEGEKLISFSDAFLITYYANGGQENLAFDLFNKMKKEGLALNDKIYISLIDAFVRGKNLEQAFELFEEMQAAGMTANEIIYTSLFNLCVENRDFDKATEVFKEMEERGITPSHSMNLAREDLFLMKYMGDESEDEQCPATSSEDSESASPSDQSPVKNQRGKSLKGDLSSDSKEPNEKNDEDQDALPLVVKDASPKAKPSANDQKTIIADLDDEVFVESENDQDLSDELLYPEENEMALLKQLLNNDALQSKSNMLPLAQKLEIAKKVGIFLEELNLEHTAVTDQQLEEVLIACPNLKKLKLKFCKSLTTGVIKKLPMELKKLDLSHNGHLKYALDDLPQALEELDLAYWIALKDDDLKKLPLKLNRLNLQSCFQLNDEAIENLSKSSITILDLSGLNSLSFGMIDLLPKTLSELKLELKELPENVVMNWPKLKTLDLSTCTSKLTDASVKFLPTSLEELNLLNSNQLTDAMVKYLPRNLKRLNLSACELLTDKATKDLPQSLLSLDLSGCRLLTDEGIRNLFIGVKGLKEINLSKCDNLTSAVIDMLPKAIKKLDVRNCSGIGKINVQRLPQDLEELYLSDFLRVADVKDLPKKLKVLEINFFDNISTEVFDTLPQGLEKLKIDSYNLTDDTMGNLPKGLKQLKFVSSRDLTDKMVKKLPSNLAELYISDARNLSEAIVDQLPKRIKVLDLLNCSPALTQAIRKKLPHVLLADLFD